MGLSKIKTILLQAQAPPSSSQTRTSKKRLKLMSSFWSNAMLCWLCSGFPGVHQQCPCWRAPFQPLQQRGTVRDHCRAGISHQKQLLFIIFLGVLGSSDEKRTPEDATHTRQCHDHVSLFLFTKYELFESQIQVQKRFYTSSLCNVLSLEYAQMV